MNNYNSHPHHVYYISDNDEALLIHNTPPPPYSKRATTLHAKPTFWSPRQPPQNDGWRTLRGTRFVKSISRQVAFSIDNNRNNTTTTATTMEPVPLDINIPTSGNNYVSSTNAVAINTFNGVRNRTDTVTSHDNEQEEDDGEREERSTRRQIRRRRRELNNILAPSNISSQSYNDNNSKCTVM